MVTIFEKPLEEMDNVEFIVSYRDVLAELHKQITTAAFAKIKKNSSILTEEDKLLMEVFNIASIHIFYLLCSLEDARKTEKEFNYMKSKLDRWVAEHKGEQND